MYVRLLVAHGLFRWVIISIGIAVLTTAGWSLSHGQPFERRHISLGHAFAITLDIQAVIGMLLYAVFSPLTTIATDLGITPPPGSEMQFFSTTHSEVMAVALVCVHVSGGVVRRGTSSSARLWRTLVCYGSTLTLLLAGVPWWRSWLRI